MNRSLLKMKERRRITRYIMKLRLKNFESTQDRRQADGLNSSFEIGYNIKKVLKTDHSTPSKRSSSHIRSTKNSMSGFNPLYSYDSRPNLLMRFPKPVDKSTTSTDSRQNSTPGKNKRQSAAPSKKIWMNNTQTANNDYIELSSNSILDLPQDRINKSASKEKGLQSSSTIRSPDGYQSGVIFPGDRDIERISSEFQEWCDVIRDRGQANANLASQLKENFILMMSKIEKNIADSELKWQVKGYEEEIQKIKLKNKELELKNQNIEKENQRLWEFVSRIQISGHQHQPETLKNPSEVKPKQLQKNLGQNSQFDIEKIIDLFEKQHMVINNLKKKEVKYIQLLVAIKKQGIDIEKIYQNKVKNIPAQSKMKMGQPDLREAFEEYNDCDLSTSEQESKPLQKRNTEKYLPQHKFPYGDSEISTENAYEDNNFNQIQDGNSSIIHHNFVDGGNHKPNHKTSNQSNENENDDSEVESEAEADENKDGGDDDNFVLYSYRELQKMGALEKNLQVSLAQENPNIPSKEIKNKFKLNMGAIQGEQRQNIGRKDSPVGFHQEFMAQIDNFSLSWRKAAEKERKHN